MDTSTAAAPIAVTEDAARKIAQLAAGEGREQAILRLRVIAGGCSGFGYRLSFEDTVAPDDHVIETGDVRVLVDPISAPIVQGSTLGFDTALLGGGLKVHNPQAVHECACGESFSV
ncbi:MAG TPA: iron-sulfur cluster assembly accessory protein [Actinomycetota bacterium]|nr:iron-sulfur cluster assembly accessory protein [Actinomycetota bacterium]